MSTTFEHLPLARIRPHVKNVRHDAVADPELVASVKTHGLLQALVAVPATDGSDMVDLIAGHRRLDALRQVGAATAPVIIRTDLTTEAQQIEAMLVENGRREDLSPIEEAEGYEQLELFGYKAKDIAQATGRNVKTVRDRLKLRVLSDDTRGRVHDGQVSITDALALADFSDDPKQLATLEATVGTHNFAWKLADAKRDRDRKVEADKEVKELTAAGIPEVTGENSRSEGPYPIHWMRDRDRSEHDGCLAWRRTSPTYLELVCTNPGSHDKPSETGDTPPPAGDQRHQDYEERRAEHQRRREEHIAAQTVRVEHARTALPLPATDKPLADLIRATAPMILAVVDELGDGAAFQRHLGRTPGAFFDQDQRDLVLRDITTNISDASIGRVLQALLISLAEWRLTDVYDEDAAREGLAYIGWLESTGHTFCDLDNEIQTSAEQLLAGDEDESEEAAS